MRLQTQCVLRVVAIDSVRTCSVAMCNQCQSPVLPFAGTGDWHYRGTGSTGSGAGSGVWDAVVEHYSEGLVSRALVARPGQLDMRKAKVRSKKECLIQVVVTRKFLSSE